MSAAASPGSARTAACCCTPAAGCAPSPPARSCRGRGVSAMLLVVDAGNTNVVMAVHDGTGWRGIWRIATEPQRTSDEYAVWLTTLLNLAGVKRDQVNAAVIGTVVPAALYHLRRLCRDWFEVEPLVALSGLDWGFEIKVDTPAEVGADRLLNA